ncbi:carbon monoxide dehydrogenase/acetyl-CoA synthase subunit alpha [bacterium BMS3Abin07]|nr:carbon monoxide dehydrogenase/acetyl-CoA synthase subunit alpha [bacterium BMS3Abin07]GBE32219.1 carbon monoxide dehydrogenase/acetyl-CoA synthase subunit alpha [bacterium BMS3Bbin05]HDL19994.1 CO dehydrogenase/CO-methylating acetyl-CoA synthase complex subunit beta [Nitrospirota bacterium]HDO23501.1 CO dehydrogenase/CO-methylating acetyl-CoA synthase complex subunit beta [Nitrospirota bacterium]HDZ86984.1 CO dehydrogenase/CO-methylating acetyl-CoA synthase complex subunit beta [Nitrospirota
MSKLIASAAIRGAHHVFNNAEELLKKVIDGKGEDYLFEFPDTAFYLPMIYAMTGKQVKTVGDMKEALEMTRGLLHEEPDEHIWKPYLGEALDSGMAILFAEEIWLALRYIEGLEPVTDPDTGYVYNGFITDTIQRNLGIQLVDGTMPGFAVIIGAAPDEDTAVNILRELQEKNILIFLSGESNGDSCTKQLLRKGIELGWDTRIVPLGPGTEHTLYAADWAIRASLIFGGMKPGDFKGNLRYTKERVFAFALGLGPMDDIKWATGAGAINMGFPAVCDTDVPVIHPTGVTTYEEVDKELDHAKIVQKVIEVRGLKIIVEKPPIPVAYGPAFEGERIRKDDTFIEFGGNRSAAFEWVRTRELDDIEDGKINIVGDNWQEEYEKGGVMPLGILVEVAGRKMQADFEPIIERRLHHNINEGQGIWHMGQRDINWIRISHAARKNGFALEDIGKIHHAMAHSRFKSIVDKVQVTLLTKEEDVIKMREEARSAWEIRDERMATLTDESVDTFYSCLLCQSFAPSHTCVITPERLGLCGAYNWLDGKAAFEIDPTGGNQPIQKGQTIDAVKGRWTGVDEYLKQSTGGAVETLNAYTIMDNPMTSCGCFECIVAIIPEANGVMIVQRGHTDMTPIGMKFSTLAGTVGGGLQTPGFMGVGVNFISSKKFLYADGGLKRVVWMTKALKERVKEHFEARAQEEGVPDLLDKIADETICEDSEKLLEYLTSVSHPALEMDPML